MTSSVGDLVDLATRCVQALARSGQTLATAESLTAGLVSATVASVPGASAVLRGGVATYATESKISVLGVPTEIIEAAGVISAECAEAMAVATLRLFSTTWGVSTTGVAGPDRQEDQPVGTVFVAVAGLRDVRVEQISLAGGRESVRAGSVAAVLRLLLAASGDNRHGQPTVGPADG